MTPLKNTLKNTISLIGLVLLIFQQLGCNNHPLVRIFLIPSDYEGTLRIVYEEKCGLKPKEEDGREEFEFPKNGILILKTGIDRIINTTYYLVDSKGQKIKITQLANFNDRIDRTLVIIAGGIGVSSNIKSNDTL